MDDANTPKESGTGIVDTRVTPLGRFESSFRVDSSSSPVAWRNAATAALSSFGPSGAPRAFLAATRSAASASAGVSSSRNPSLRRNPACSVNAEGSSNASGASRAGARRKSRFGASVAAPPATGTNAASLSAVSSVSSSASAQSPRTPSAVDTAVHGSPAAGVQRASAATPPPLLGGDPNAIKCAAIALAPGSLLTRSLDLANCGGTNSAGNTGRCMNTEAQCSGSIACEKDVRTLHPTQPGPGCPGTPSAAGTKGTPRTTSHMLAV